MAEFTYIATWNDFWHMLDIIETYEMFHYIPNTCCLTKKPIMLTSLRTSEFSKLLYNNPAAGSVYMHINGVSYDSIIMNEVPDMGYFVSQMQPMLQWNIVGDFIDSNNKDARRTFEYSAESDWPQGGVRKLNCGMLSYPDEYPDATGRWHKRSPELKAAYQRVCSHLKKVMVRHKFMSYIWMGREAHQLVKEGKAVVIAHV